MEEKFNKTMTIIVFILLIVIVFLIINLTASPWTACVNGCR